MNRKDEHIEYALKQKTTTNDFDLVDFVHQSVPSISYDDVSLSATMFGRIFDYPIYINAMTGGSDKAYEVNRKLAELAKHFNIPLATGSLSNAIKGININSYTIIREVNKDGFIIANIGADKSLEDAKKAVDIMNADALQIHVNALQEIIMPEGERDFSKWKTNISNMVSHFNIPVIIKEVGFGMSRETIMELKEYGAASFDVSGKGGTNFAVIENERLKNNMDYLNNHGLSTVQSLLEASEFSGIIAYASGGIRNPFDVVKALALGAKGVGLSGYFLKLVQENTVKNAIKAFEEFLHELKLIMTFLDCKNIESLSKKAIIFDSKIINYLNQRNISWR